MIQIFPPGGSVDYGNNVAPPPSAATWTPTITNTAGGGFTTTVQAARYQQIGKFVMFAIVFTVTAAGGGGYINITLPVTAVTNGGAVAGIENTTAGVAVVGDISGASINQLRVYNNTGTAVLNYKIWLSGVYEAA